jgi:hypothetical protein
MIDWVQPSQGLRLPALPDIETHIMKQRFVLLDELLCSHPALSSILRLAMLNGGHHLMLCC